MTIFNGTLVSYVYRTSSSETSENLNSRRWTKQWSCHSVLWSSLAVGLETPVASQNCLIFRIHSSFGQQIVPSMQRNSFLRTWKESTEWSTTFTCVAASLAAFPGRLPSRLFGFFFVVLGGSNFRVNFWNFEFKGIWVIADDSLWRSSFH